MQKSDKITLISTIVLVGFVFAVIFHYILGYYCGFEYPLNTFLLLPSEAIGDFWDLLPKIKGFAPYVAPAEWQNYFPLGYLILVPFAYIKSKVFAYIVFVLIFISYFWYANVKNATCEKFSKLQNFQNIFVLSFLTYPFLYILDRGNLDMMIFILFASFVFALEKNKYQGAALFLGVINAIKPFSVLFLLLFLFEKKYREFFLSVATSFLLIVGGFLLFKGSIFDQISVMIQSLEYFHVSFILFISSGTVNSSSLFMALKYLLSNQLGLIPTTELVKICAPISFLITLFTGVFAWKEKIFWKRITLLTLYMVVVPYASFDYKLLFLFVPMWLFFRAKETRWDLVYAVLFALLLIPKRFLMVPIESFSQIKFYLLSVVLNPIMILLFMGLIVAEGFYNKKKDAE